MDRPHTRGIVHGDVNPHNIFVTDGGEIRALDLGSSHGTPAGPWIADLAAPALLASSDRLAGSTPVASFMLVDAIGRVQSPQDLLRANGRVLRLRRRWRERLPA